MPIVSILWAILDIFLSLAALLWPIHALISGVLFFCCWVTQITVWMSCQITLAGQGSFVGYGWCPNAGIPSYEEMVDTDSGRLADAKFDALVGKTNTLALMRSIFGIVVATGALAYVVLAAVAVGRNRNVKRPSVVVNKDVELSSASTSS